MKKLGIMITLLLVVLLACVGLAITEGMENSATGKPTYRVYGYDKPGEFPVHGMIYIDGIYAENAKAYQAVFTRNDGTEYQTYNIPLDTWSVGYPMDEPGEFTLTVYSCTWPDNVATPTDLLPYENTATPTDLNPYGGAATPTDLDPYGSFATPTDLSSYRSVAGDPVVFQVTSMGPVLSGENPQVILGDVPTEVPKGEPIELELNWGDKAAYAKAYIYHENQPAEDNNQLVYGFASRGNTLNLSTWPLIPGETYRAEVRLSALGFDDITQSFLFTVTDNGQGSIVEGWQWTLKEDLVRPIDSTVSVGVYYPNVDYIRLIEYIDGEYYSESNGRYGSAFLRVDTDTSGRVTFRAEADVQIDEYHFETIESVCEKTITITEGIQGPKIKLISEPMQKTGEDVIVRFTRTNVAHGANNVQYDLNVQYVTEYNSYIVYTEDGVRSSSEIRIPWQELERYGIREDSQLYVTVRAHGSGYYPTWGSQTIYMIGAEDENFTISVESLDILAESGHAIVYRNEPYEIQINGIPEGISEIDILNNMTWQSYALTERETQIYEMDGISSHEDTPVVARYWTEPEGYCYSNYVLLTPSGQGTMSEPLVSTNLGEEAGRIDRGESIKIRLDNLDDYQVPVRLSACIVKSPGNPNISYGENCCDIQDENTVLRIATGMLPADANNYILKVWANDRNDKWDQSQAIEIPFTVNDGIEQGTIKITAAAGDVEIEGDSSPLQVMTGEYYTVGVYAPGARKVELYSGAGYGDDYEQAEAYGPYTEMSDSIPDATVICYYAKVYYPGVNEPVRSETVTIHVKAPFGYLYDMFKIQIPVIVTPGESFAVSLFSDDEENTLCPDRFEVYIDDGHDNYVWNGYADNALTVTVPAKDRSGNNLLTSGQMYKVYIQAYKKGYDGLGDNEYFYAVASEMQQKAVLTVNGESDQVDLLTGESFTVSISGLPEGTTAVAVLGLGLNNNWSYYPVPDGATSYSCDSVSYLSGSEDIIAKYTTQAIENNQDWNEVNWEGYTNTVKLSVFTRGPLPAPVVSTNLTETVEGDQTKLSIEQGNSVVITLDNLEDYTEMDNVHLSGSILMIEDGAETQRVYNSVWINDQNNQLSIPTYGLPLQTDDYILRLIMRDSSYMWDQSTAVDIPFTVVNNLQVGDIRITVSPIAPELYENCRIEVFAPGASSIDLYIGDYETNWWYDSRDGFYYGTNISQADLIERKYFAIAHYPDQEGIVRSEIITVPTKSPYGSFEDVLTASVPSFVTPGEPLTISFQDVNEETNLIPRYISISVYDLNYFWLYGTSFWNQKTITIPTDGCNFFEEGKAYRINIDAELQGYTRFDGNYIVYATSEQQGLLTINDVSDQVDLLMGETFEISVSGLPEGVTAVSVLHPDGGNYWMNYPVTDGSTSVLCNDTVYLPVKHMNMVAKYTTQAIDEYPNWDEVTWEGFTNTVDVSVFSLGTLPTPVVSTNLTEITEGDQTRLSVEWGEKVAVTLENVEDYADFNTISICGYVYQVGNDGGMYWINDYCARVNAEHSELYVSTGNLSDTAEYVLHIYMMDNEHKWEESTYIEIPFCVISNMQAGEIRISASVTEIMTTEEYSIQVLAPGAERIELYRGNDESNDYLGTYFASCYECSFRKYNSDEEQFFALVYYPDTAEPVHSDVVTVRTIAPYGDLYDKIYSEVPQVVKPDEPFTVEVKTFDGEEELIPDEIYVYLCDRYGNWLWNTTVYNETSVTVPARNDNNVILLENGKNYRLECSVYKKGYNSYEGIRREIYAASPEMQQGTLTINGNSEQVEIIARENYTVSVTGMPENVTAVCVQVPDRGNEWSYHVITDGSTSISDDPYAEHPVSNSIIFAKFTTQEIGEYPNWDEVIWDGFTNSVNVTIICTHKETYEQTIWSEDSVCEADNKFTHTHTGHGGKWKVCSCCGEKLELLEEVTSLTEGHSYSDGVCMVCGYECPHDPEDIVHEKIFCGDCTCVDEYTHHVTGTYEEHDYCGHCGKWIGEITETPVDQDESHHYDECYWCNMCGHQSEAEHYLNVTCDWEDGSWMPVELHGNKLLSVINAESDLSDVFTYQWYLWNENNWYPIDNATEAVCEMQDITYRTDGYVRVSDGYTYRDIYFTLYVENGLTAYVENDQRDITVQPGETATLNVVASCNNGELTYQWYEYQAGYGELKIENAIDASYITEPIAECKQYICCVNDMYGNSTGYIRFYIHIDNGFTASAENNQIGITVQPGETATLNVVASCNYGELTYQWYEYQAGYEGQMIENATDASYTTGLITEYRQYFCQVRDMYGNMGEIWFHIYLDNNLAIEQVGEPIRYIETGETVTLKVNATCSAGGKTYQWYETTYNYDGEYWESPSLIEGATSDTYTTDAVFTYKRYECYAYDEYGNSCSTYFNIMIDNNLTATALGNEYHFIVYAGESVTLNAVASCNNGQVYYQWYDGRREKIENATGSSYTTDALYADSEYICYVQDDYGNRCETAWFTVNIDSGLTAEPAGAYVFHASESPITLAVNASNQLSGSEFSYDWYSLSFGWLDSTSDNTYTLTNPDAGEYYCIVNDGHKTATVWFYIAEGAFAQACGSSGYGVKPNEQVTLRVAAWNAQNDITYQWFDNDGAVIDGETQAVYSFNATCRKNVYCHVEGTDLNTNIWFSVNIGSLQIDPPAMKKVYMIPANESIQIVRNITSTYDKNPSITWIKDDEVLPGEVSNTLTVSTGGRYVFKAMDSYGNAYEYTFWCVEGEPETVSESDTVTGTTSTAIVYQFIPNEDGIYQVEGNCQICRTDDENIYLNLQYSPDIIRFENGQVYYVILNNTSDSFRYGLIQKDREEYTITLQQGQNFWIPNLVINGCGYSVENSISDNQTVVYNDGYYFETLSTGAANLTINYGCQVQRVFHITVVDTNVVTLPNQLQTIEEDAFSGDAGIGLIRLGSNVQTVKSGAFANTGNITVIVENGNTSFENGVFTNANPLIICTAESNVVWYCNTNRIPYLYQ